MLAVTHGGGGGVSIITTPRIQTYSSSSHKTSSSDSSNGSCNCAWWDVVCQAQCAGQDIENFFSGAPSYITKGVLPYLQKIPTIGGYVSEIPDISTGVASIESGIADIPGIGAGILGIEAATKYLPSIDSFINNRINPALNTIMGEMPQISKNLQSLPAMAQNIMNIPSQLESDLRGLVPYFGGLESLMVQKLQPITSNLLTVKSYLQSMATMPTNVAETLLLSQEIEQDISKLPQEFPIEITTLETYMNYEIGNLESWIQHNISETGIEKGITTIEKGVTKIESELKNLPKNIEKYVEEGVDTALKDIWKEIEIPIIAIGGLAFLMLMQPSNCCPTPKYKPHMPSEVI